MVKNIQNVRGIHDYLPSDIHLWQRAEKIIKQVLTNYGYQEIRLPIIEKTILFKRTIGAITDIIQKEMYIFTDRNGDSLTLRPEGTVGCVRSLITHNLLNNYEQRLWYLGPMFRYERPQKGRYRQFYQLGVEIFGLEGPDIDAELIIMTARWWKLLGITDHIYLELNSIGSLESRVLYRKALLYFLEQNKTKLDKDSKKRMYTNPLRILDSKNPEIQKLLNQAPLLENFFDERSRLHFEKLCVFLQDIGINYTVNKKLVRGLDYYNFTVFEWKTDKLGSQNTVCAGGRYDGLVAQLVDISIPAIGLAIGMERLILLLQTTELNIYPRKADIFIISISHAVKFAALQLAETIRDILPKIKIINNFKNTSLKKQFAQAAKLGVRISLILGDKEIQEKIVLVKDMLTGKQQVCQQSNIANLLKKFYVTDIPHDISRLSYDS